MLIIGNPHLATGGQRKGGHRRLGGRSLCSIRQQRQRRSIRANITPNMRVNTTLPMIEMFHPKKNFMTASIRTNTPRCANQRKTVPSTFDDNVNRA